MLNARVGALEDITPDYRLGKAEGKIDELENRLDEMEREMTRLQEELTRRRKSRRATPVVTTGSGSSDDPMEILSESERRQTLRQRAVKGKRVHRKALTKNKEVPSRYSLW